MLYAQRTVREENPQSHGGKPPFWSGNLVGASPYAAAFFEYFRELLTCEVRRILLLGSSVNRVSQQGELQATYLATQSASLLESGVSSTTANPLPSSLITLNLLLL